MKKFLKWFFGIVISFALILGIAFLALINLTPRKLKLENMSLGGYTIEELGLADTKLITIYKNFNAIGKAQEGEVVQNGFNEEQASGAAAEGFAGSPLENSSDYSSLITSPAIYDNRYLVSYSDTTLAYIFNNIVQNASSEDEAIQYLHDANVEIRELTVGVSSGTGSVRIVSHIGLGEFKTEIESELGAAASFIHVPDQVYMVNELTFTVNAEGKLVCTPVSITINGNANDPVGEAVIRLALNKIGGGTTEEALNENLGKALASVVYNLGKVGTAQTDANRVITGGVVYGMGGVSAHCITVITHTA